MPRLELIFLHSANGGGCFRWRDEGSICHRSRKILRVAVTRARKHVLILDPAFPNCPLLQGMCCRFRSKDGILRSGRMDANCYARKCGGRDWFVWELEYRLHSENSDVSKFNSI
jgi:hypothetical protein